MLPRGCYKRIQNRGCICVSDGQFEFNRCTQLAECNTFTSPAGKCPRDQRYTHSAGNKIDDRLHLGSFLPDMRHKSRARARVDNDPVKAGTLPCRKQYPRIVCEIG